MSSVPDLLTSTGKREKVRARSIRYLIGRPAAIFVVLATLFGLPAIVLIPPLRGADEPAHFLRAYGIAHGQVAPKLVDEHGRKGLFLPAAMHDGYDYFETVRYRFGTPQFNYRDVFAEYVRRKPAPADAAPVFLLYAGSEGYAPLAYLPYLPAVWLARALGLDFVMTLLLMRLFGFVTAGALAAYAIALVPRLGWPFLLIAMLPIALFERSIVAADGTALSLAMLVTAVSLRAACGQSAPLWQRSLWMTLCVLIKPSQVALIGLEAMVRPFSALLQHWRVSLLVVGPGLLLTVLWLLVGGADVAAWRMIEGTGEPAEHFRIGWKLLFLFEQPKHFLHAMLGSLANTYDLWRESIGGLGWRDTHLPLAVYSLLSAMFLATSLVRLDVSRRVRGRIVAAATVTVLGYWIAIFLIFYLAWTPIQTEFIHGVQGRYFTIILPPAALAIAAGINRGPPGRVTAAIALAGALLSGVAMLDAVIRTQW